MYKEILVNFILKKASVIIILTIIFIGSLNFTNSFQDLKAQVNIITINPDGTVIGTNKLLREGNVYAFTGNIEGSIVVEKDDIVIDGKGYTLSGIENQGLGIELIERSGVTITNIEIIDYSNCIYVHSSSNCIISENDVGNYYQGIRAEKSFNITISNNNCISNIPFQGETVLEYITRQGRGIILGLSSSCYVYQNHIEGNMWGMELENQYTSPTNKFFENIVLNNDYGVVIRSFSNNEFYHNSFIGNTLQVYDWVKYNSESYSFSQNIWDNGFTFGGNYWSDYTGEDSYSGLYQNETCRDGIGDKAYIIDENNQDSYPFVSPWQEHLNPPVARFNYSPSATYALQQITLDSSNSYDLDENIASFSWNFGDGIIESTVNPIINHTYNLPNEYDVTLTAFDEKGLSTTYSQQIDVKGISFISISTSSFTTASGIAVEITGTLQDMFNQPLINEIVLLEYIFPGSTNWHSIQSPSTDNMGNYETIWFPSATGQFTLKATWMGNSSLDGSQNTTMLSILFHEEKHLFSVESNSTISSIEFDSDNRVLSFSVSGSEGTEGFTRVTLAKNLISDLNTLEVKINDNSIEYTISDFEDSWILYFTYSHSTHEVTVFLGTSSFLSLDNFTFNILIGSIAIGIAVVLSIFYFRGKKNKQKIKTRKT